MDLKYHQQKAFNTGQLGAYSDAFCLVPKLVFHSRSTVLWIMVALGCFTVNSMAASTLSHFFCCKISSLEISNLGGLAIVRHSVSPWAVRLEEGCG